ncbi:MAG: succinylglutamate desuccinylase/aspartoacylase family protein [Planctomycetota bacterium]|jgi:predicted deacylase
MREPFVIAGIEVRPGRSKEIKLRVSEQVTAGPVFIPATVFHGKRAGPRGFVVAAVHGDEINGVEMVRRLRADLRADRVRGTLVLVPIANPLSFGMQNRYLPDGRDLNRRFPGSRRGSVASVVAAALFRKIVKGCDFGIDLHTAARGKASFPHVRADMSIPAVRRIARAFGAEVVVDMGGDRGMLRREATGRGIPVISYEAGEPLKFQRHLVDRGVAGIRRVLASAGMIRSRARKPAFQAAVKERKWVRARRGGILMLNVRPGDIIDRGEVIAVNTKPYGKELREIRAPFRGFVLATATLPMVHPGSAVCHLVGLGRRFPEARRRLRVRRDLFA